MKPFAKKLLALTSAAAISLSAIPAVLSVDAEPAPVIVSAQGISMKISEEPSPARARTVSTMQLRTRVDAIDMDLTGSSDAGELEVTAAQPAKFLPCNGAAVDAKSLQPTRQLTSEEAVVIMDRVVSIFSGQTDEPQRYLGEDVAELALTKVGCRYVSGGHGPSKFDCSGLVYWVYKQFGYELKPGARNQWSILGSTVKKADLLPGDLLFYSRNGKASGIFHVGIYIGEGKFVHAANSRKGVIVTNMSDSWYANRYLGAKRAIG